MPFILISSKVIPRPVMKRKFNAIAEPIMGSLFAAANAAITTLRSSLSSTLQNPIKIASIPDFATLGITDESEIRGELRQGPSVRFEVGPDLTEFSVPARLLVYYSPWFCCNIKKFPDIRNPIKLSKATPDAFCRVLTFLNEGHLGKFPDRHSDVKDGVINGHPDLCFFLFDIYYLAEVFAIYHLRARVIDKFALWCDCTREAGYRLEFLTPDLVMSVYARTSLNSELRRTVTDQLIIECTAKPFDYAKWEGCFEKCKSLRVKITKAVADRIMRGWAAEANEYFSLDKTGLDQTIEDNGRLAEWWKGPF